MGVSKLEDRIPKRAIGILGKALDPNPKNRPSIDDLKIALDEIRKHLNIQDGSQNTKNDIIGNPWFWVSVILFLMFLAVLLNR